MRVIVGSSTETSLEVQSDALGKLSVPLDGILGLLLAAEGQTAAFDSHWERIRIEPRSTEVVWLANGDRLAGAFLGLDDSKIKIQVGGKPALVDRAGVVALGFDSKLVNYPRPRSDFLELTLKDGSRLGVTEARLDDGMILATTRYGAGIRFSLTELVRVDGRSKSVVYLSERKVARDQYLSYVGPTREYRIDRTVDGHVFHLSGQTYDRGIGTQSTTFLAFKIEPGDRRFQGLVGVDERAGPLGSVVFRVLVDGKERLKTPPMTDHDVPRVLDVDLLDAKFLILATEFGDRGDVRDLADWVEARIIR
jgi:NPCBM/NEW2 domain